MKDRYRWFLVVLFATAMAWVEASVVFYLRVMIRRVQPYQLDPLPSSFGLGEAELVREAATLVMLLTVGWLAGVDWRSRLGYFVLGFGIWDIAYYIFLVPLTGWPKSLLDWDILFLIPLPWWGPVLAPASIALLLVMGGTLVTQFPHGDRNPWPRRYAWLPGTLGMTLALYTFMADSLRALPEGPSAVRNVLPVSFDWMLFTIALALMTIPLLDMVWQRWILSPGLRGQEQSGETAA
jgi:hypothetical protein